MKSPCINVCQMDPVRGVCSGCCRTLEEIACWSSLSDAERQRVMSGLAERKRRLKLVEATVPPLSGSKARGA